MRHHSINALLVVVLLTTISWTMAGIPIVCCQFNGVALTDCTCINEGTGRFAASVRSGQYKKFHFLLSNYSAVTGIL